MPENNPTTLRFHRFRLRGGDHDGLFLGCRSDLASDQEAADFAGRVYAWAISRYGAERIEVEPIVCVYPEGWPSYTEQLLAVGRANPWIAMAYDPPFTAESLAPCPDLATLVDQVFVGNWSLGQGFVWHNVAVINQVDGGHEWLVCIRGQAVESFSHRRPGGFLDALEALRGAEG